MKATLYTGSTQRPTNGVALSSRNQDRKDVRNYVAVLVIQVEASHASEIVKYFDIVPCQRYPFGSELSFESPELYPAHCCKNVAHVESPSLTSNVKFPASFARKSLIGILFYAQKPGITHKIGNVLIGRHNGSAFAARNILDTIEAEADNITGCTNTVPLPAAPEGVCGILNDAKPVSFR
ncbi:MAG TPA: hypothetical protein VK513_13720 [Terriglobales bacterium]|nr:hypothetical protein [Terriglobales bacterium]